LESLNFQGKKVLLKINFETPTLLKETQLFKKKKKIKYLKLIANAKSFDKFA
jgi:hypothetical protein